MRNSQPGKGVKPRIWTLNGQAGLALLALGGLGPAHADDPPGHSDVVEEIPGLLDQYSELGDFELPSLSAAELGALAAGETVVSLHRNRTAHPTGKVHAMRVIGWHIVKAPRLLVWLSMLGRSESSSTRSIHAVLVRRPAGAYVSYHHMDLPWPFEDRHWLLNSEQNVNLATESHDDIWEHRWSLLPLDDALLDAAYENTRLRGLTRGAFDDSEYLLANRGAWIVFDLGSNGTLVAGSIYIDLGGHVPEALVQSFAKRQIRAFFGSLDALPGARYVAKPVIHDGRGLPITEEAARRAVRDWADPPRLAAAHAVTTDRP